MMDAVEYLKAKNRLLCKHESDFTCINCPLSHMNNDKKITCGKFEKNYPEKAVKIVEQWAKEHPKKTYLSVLLEKFPKTFLCEGGTPAMCPHRIFGGEEWEKCNCGNDCIDCWNREYKEEK